jgi:aspartyl-tRNA(Asn)/glutamyl-tRNA(Gln) amidotransferase subunit B
MLIDEGAISFVIAKTVFEEVVTGAPRGHRRAKDSQVSDEGPIAAIEQVLSANADKVVEYRGGEDKLFGLRRPGDESDGRQGNRRS